MCTDGIQIFIPHSYANLEQTSLRIRKILADSLLIVPFSVKGL